MFWKIWIEDFPDLCFPQLCSFLWVVETNVAFEKCETLFLTLLHQKQNDCHLRIVYKSYEDLLEVHQSKRPINFNSVCFLTHVYLLDSLKLSIRCKRALVSFILMFVQSAILTMILSINGKYLRCFPCLLWSLGQDNLFRPKWYRIFALYQWLLDTLSSTKFSLCFCLSLDQNNHKVHSKHNLCSYIRFLCSCFNLMNCQCRERFDCGWVLFLVRIFRFFRLLFFL